MSANMWRSRWRALCGALSGAAWLTAVWGAWCGSAWAAPHWTQECPDRIEHASWCHHLPSEGRMALRVPMPGSADGLWGFVDIHGRMVIEPVYGSVMAFSKGLAAAQKDGKWGFIDLKGQWRFEPRYDDVTSFDAQGLAWAVERGRLLRLSATGQALPWLSEAGSFDLDHRGMQEDRAIRVRVTPPSETWRLDTGEVVPWPREVVELGRPVGGTWPVRVRLPSGRNWWGLWSLQEGRWLASPLALRSELEPLLHAGKVAVHRAGGWFFVDLAGQPLSSTRYRAIEMDRPGLWVVSPAHSEWVWLGPDLRELHRAQGHVTSPRQERWGDAWVYDLHEALLIVLPDDRIEVLDTSEHDEHLQNGWIWLSPKRDGGAPDLIGPDGRSVLSADERERLKHHRIEFLWEGDRSPAVPGAVRALLHPHDDTAEPGVVTADLRVLTRAEWALLMPGQLPSDPVVVQRTDGRFGAIDGMGRWLISPEWLGMEAFHHGLTWGRHPDHDGGSRSVLIGSDGRRLALPPGALTACGGWSGPWLRCQNSEGNAAGTTFIAPLAAKRVNAPEVDELREARGDWLFARQGEQWGVLGPDGRWRVPPLTDSPEAIEWLDDHVVRVSVHAQGQLTHQLWHVAGGRALTPPRRGQSWRLAADRYLVAGELAGMELLDASGRVVLRTPWWGTDPHAEDGLAWTSPGQQLARLLPDGTLAPAPVHSPNGGEPMTEADDEAADARAVQGWQLRLSARCGQLIVRGPSGQQTWPKQAVRCPQR